jgi:hypothetical protein
VDGEKLLAGARAKLNRGKPKGAASSVDRLLATAKGRGSVRKHDAASVDARLAAARVQLRAGRSGN